MWAQGESPLSLARAYEEDGAYEKAVGIYERLYREDSTNAVVVTKLKGVYRILGVNEKRVPLIRRQIAQDSLNVSLWAELADAYYRLTDLPAARRSVDRAVAIDPGSLTTYRVVAAMMLENRWFEDLESLYRGARSPLNDPNAFTLELASLYVYRGDYYRSTVEYLRYYLQDRSRYEYVKTQVLQTAEDDSACARIAEALFHELSALPKDVNLRRLLMEVYTRGHRHDLAFEQSKLADELGGKNGVDVLRFAQLSFESNRYDVALRAYRHFLQLYARAPQAEMGVARCLEYLAAEGAASGKEPEDSTGQARESRIFSDAVGAYRSMIENYPSTSWSAESRFRLGELYLMRFGDVDEALETYRKVASEYSSTEFRWEAAFRIGECLLIQNKIKAAEELFAGIRQQGADGPTRDRASFYMAELAFYEGHFDSCRGLMNRLASVRDGLFVNDALAYVLLLEEARKDTATLTWYSRGALLRRQRRASQALSMFAELLARNPESPLADEALYQSSLALADQQKFEEAAETLRLLMQRYPKSPLGDLSLLTIGRLYQEHLHEGPKAIEAYKELLVRFPRSIHATDARKRLRALESLQKKSS
jgi:tetratricopeptide (TPR) repeat protein